MPDPNTSVPASHLSLELKGGLPLNTGPSSNAFPTSHELLVITSSDVSRWKADGTIVQSFHSPDAGVVAAAAIASKNRNSEPGMLALADSHVILLVHAEGGAVRESYGLKGDEGSIRLLAYAPATNVLYFTTTIDHAVRAYSVGQERLLDAPSHGHPSPITTLAASPDARTLVSCSAAPPTIHVQCLEACKPPIVLKPQISDAAVVAAAFHPDRPGILALAFADGSLAAYDANKLIVPTEKDAEEEIRVREGTSTELGYIRGVHAVVGAPSKAVESIAFVPGFQWRLVSVGGDGQCCVVFIRRKGGLGGKMVKKWHVGGAATSLAIILPGSQGVAQDETTGRAGKRDSHGDDAVLAVGREDGEVTLYDLTGNIQCRQRFGSKILGLEWQPSLERKKRNVQPMNKRGLIMRLDMNRPTARYSISPVHTKFDALNAINTQRSRRGRKSSLRYLPSTGYSTIDDDDAGHNIFELEVITTPPFVLTEKDEMKHHKTSRFSLESDSSSTAATPTPRFTIVDPKRSPTSPKSPKSPRSPKRTGRSLVVHKRSKRATRLLPSSKAINIDTALGSLSLRTERRAHSSLYIKMGGDSTYSRSSSSPQESSTSLAGLPQKHSPFQQDPSDADWVDAAPSQPQASRPLYRQQPNQSAKRHPDPLPSLSSFVTQRTAAPKLSQNETSTSNDTVVSWVAAYHKPQKTGLRRPASPQWPTSDSSLPPTPTSSPKRVRDPPQTPSPPSTSNSTIVDWGSSGLLRNPRISPYHRETRIPSKMSHLPRHEHPGVPRESRMPTQINATPRTSTRNATPATPPTVVRAQHRRHNAQSEPISDVDAISYHPTPRLPPLSPPTRPAPSAPFLRQSLPGASASIANNNRDGAPLRAPNRPAPVPVPAEIGVAFPAPVHAQLNAMEARLHAEIQDVRRDLGSRLKAYRREVDLAGRVQDAGMRRVLEENEELRRELRRVEVKNTELRFAGNGGGCGKVMGWMGCLGGGGRRAE